MACYACTVEDGLVEVLAELAGLDLPLGQYVVVGSGALAARGLRPARDLDIVVTKALFAALAEDPTWHAITRPRGKPALVRGPVEIYLDVNHKEVAPATEDLIARAAVIRGFAFLDLQDLRRFKAAYDRAKDGRDILLIDDALAAGLP